MDCTHTHTLPLAILLEDFTSSTSISKRRKGRNISIDGQSEDHIWRNWIKKEDAKVVCECVCIHRSPAGIRPHFCALSIHFVLPSRLASTYLKRNLSVVFSREENWIDPEDGTNRRERVPLKINLRFPQVLAAFFFSFWSVPSKKKLN